MRFIGLATGAMALALFLGEASASPPPPEPATAPVTRPAEEAGACQSDRAKSWAEKRIEQFRRQTGRSRPTRQPSAARSYDQATLEIDKFQGAPGDEVVIEASGLAPEEPLTVGVSGSGQTFVALGEVAADRRGRLRAGVTVPDWALPRDRMLFTLKRAGGSSVSSTPFRVAAASGGGFSAAGAPMTVNGWLVQGVECPMLRTADGRNFALAGAPQGLDYGAYVEVSGARRRISSCQAGEGTIEVQALAPADPP